MANLIKDLVDIMTEARERSVAQLISNRLKSNAPISRRSVAEEFRHLNELVQSNANGQVAQLFFAPILAATDKVISSKYWNENLDGIFLDLYALYEAVTALENDIERRAAAGDDEVSKFRASLLKTIQQAIIFELLRDNRQYQDIKILDFTGLLNESIYTPKAKIDADIYAVELQPKHRFLLQSANRNLRKTTVKTRTIGPGTRSDNSDNFGTEKMLDRVPATFWAEMTLSDMPIAQLYRVSSPNPSIQRPVRTIFGPVVEVDVVFSHPEQCNHIRLLPFGQHPIKIIDLSYKETNEAENWKRIPGFTTQDDPTDGWFEINFDVITVNTVRIAVAQESYTQNIFHLPKNIVYSTDVLRYIVDDLFRRDISGKTLSEQEFGLVALDNRSAAYLDMLDEFENDFIAKDVPKNNIREFQLMQEEVDSSARASSRIDPRSAESLLEAIGSENRNALQDDLVSIKKYQYIYGIRELEIGFAIYQPVGFYESPKFKSNATITDVELEVDDHNVQFEDDMGPFIRSSVEYEIELGPSRRIPIVPNNYTGSLGEFIIPDEYMRVDRTTNRARTRFKVKSESVVLRKNGEYVPVSDYNFTGDTSGYGSLAINETKFAPNAIYSLSYYPQASEASIDVLDMYNSELTTPPERFDASGPNNSIELSAFPYIEYEIINQTGLFRIESEEVASWRWQSPSEAYTAGTITYYPKIVSLSGTVHSGNRTVNGIDTDFDSNMTATYSTDPYTYEIRFRDRKETSIVDSWTGADVIVLDEIPEVTEEFALSFGESYNSGDGSISTSYTIDVAYLVDGQTFGMGNPVYEPMEVTINGRKARNRTKYAEIEQPAFAARPRSETTRDFIHRGNKIYFDAPVEGTIDVSYRWITRYIKLNASLYNHQPVFSVVTPQIHEARMWLKTSPL